MAGETIFVLAISILALILACASWSFKYSIKEGRELARKVETLTSRVELMAQEIKL